MSFVNLWIHIGCKPHVGISSKGISHALGRLAHPGASEVVGLEVSVAETIGAFIDNHLPYLVPGVLSLGAVDIVGFFKIDGDFTEYHDKPAIAEGPDHTRFTDIFVVEGFSKDARTKMGNRLVAGMDDSVHASPFCGIFPVVGLLGGIFQEWDASVQDTGITHALHADAVDAASSVRWNKVVDAVYVPHEWIHQCVHSGLREGSVGPHVAVRYHIPR